MGGRWKRLGLTGTAVLLLAGGIVLYSRRDREPEAASATPQPVPVIATTVQQRDVPIILTGLGTVTALNAATVRHQITGLLVSIDFQEGQSVKKGDVLARSIGASIRRNSMRRRRHGDTRPRQNSSTKSST